MKMKYKLFKYEYVYYNQGTEERDTDYILLHVPFECSLQDCKAIIIDKLDDMNYIVDARSIKDMTINLDK